MPESHEAIVRSEGSPARKPQISSTGRPSPRATPSPRQTGSRRNAASSRGIRPSRHIGGTAVAPSGPAAGASWRDGTQRSLRVEVVELLRVALVDDVSLQLQGGGKLAVFLGEVVVEDPEALDLLHLCVPRVPLVQGVLDPLPPLLGPGQLGDVLGQALLAAPRQEPLL